MNPLSESQILICYATIDSIQWFGASNKNGACNSSLRALAYETVIRRKGINRDQKP